MKFGSYPKTHRKVYLAWRNMMLRCMSDSECHRHKYKERGITVCDRWMSFESFLLDMGTPPSDLHSLDRINNDGNYEPGNCRWADKRTQSRNRRYVRPITFNGETKLLTDWASDLGLKVSTLSMRIDHHGWPLERALSAGGK